MRTQVLEQFTDSGIKVNKRAKFLALWLDNLVICFEHLDKLGIPHKGIDPMNFVEGSKKPITALLWKLIAR